MTETDELEVDVTSDAACVARCLAGDASAWATLVDRHGGLVWAVASRHGLVRADAEDVFQSTWIVALEELSRLRDHAKFGAWIGRVARHQCMRVRRGYGIARRAHERVAEDAREETLDDAQLERLEQRARVTRALGRIGTRCAELLQLLYFADPAPAYAEIAEKLDMRIGSIGPTRARCLAKLESELGGAS